MILGGSGIDLRRISKRFGLILWGQLAFVLLTMYFFRWPSAYPGLAHRMNSPVSLCPKYVWRAEQVGFLNKVEP